MAEPTLRRPDRSGDILLFDVRVEGVEHGEVIEPVDELG